MQNNSNDENTIKLKITYEGSDLKQMESESKTAFKGIGKALKDLTGLSESELRNMKDQLSDVVDKFHDLADSVGVNPSHLRQVLNYLREIEAAQDKIQRAALDKAARIEAAEKRIIREQIDALNREEIRRKAQIAKEIADDNELARIKKSNIKYVSDLRDKGFARFNHKIKQQNAAIKRETKELLDLLNGGAGNGGNKPVRPNGFGGGTNILTFLNVAKVTIIHDLIYSLINGVKSLVSLTARAGIEAVKTAADFEQTILALEVAAGSAKAAKAELEAVDKTARNTTGLSLTEAEEGYTRLRNLGFAAATADKLLKGLAINKLISRADEQAIQRVVVNLTQLSAGSSRASQDIREIIQQMPSLRIAFGDAFGTFDAAQIADEFKNNPDEAVNKLSEAMSKAQQPAGGLNEAFQKLIDSVIVAGREFGEPLLEPLTESTKELTNFIYDNEDAWKSWGQTVADIFVGVNELISNTLGDDGNLTSLKVTGLLAEGSFKSTLPGLIATLGEEFRNIKEQNKAAEQLKQGTISSALNTDDFTFDFSSSEFGKSNEEILKERKNLQLQSIREQTKQEEMLRKENLEALENSIKLEETILKNSYKVREALLKSHITLTKDDEIRAARESGALKRDYLNAELESITNFYDRTIALQAGNDGEIAKLSAEKFKKVSEINTELKVNEIETQAEILKLEKEKLDERRELLIDFKEQQLDESKSAFSALTNLVTRAMGELYSESSNGYSDLIDLTNDYYDDILKINEQKYQLEISDLELTSEQKQLITRKHISDQRELVRENSEKILEIQDNQYKKEIDKAEKRNNRILELQRNLSGQLSSALELLAPENFSKENVDIFNEKFLKTSSIEELSGKVKLLEQAKNEALRIGDEISKTGNQQANEIAKKKYNDAFDSWFEATENLRKLKDSVTDTNVEISKMAEELNKTSGAYSNFDRIAKKVLEVRQKRELETLTQEIEYVKSRLDLANKKYKSELEREIKELEFNKIQLPSDGNRSESQQFQFDFISEKINIAQEALLKFKSTGKATSEEYLELDQRLKNLNIQMENLAGDQEIESLEQYRNSLEGLNETLEKLRSGDISEKNKQSYLAEAAVTRELIGEEQELYYLREKAARFNEGAAARYEADWLRAHIAVRESIEQSGFEISRQGEVDGQKVRAIILEQIAGAKGATEIYADTFTGLLSTVNSGMNTMFNNLFKNFGIFQSYFANLATQILSLVTNRLVMRFIEGLFGGGGSSSGGGINLGIPGGIGINLGGGGGASTPPFNPNSFAGLAGVIGSFGGGGNIGSGISEGDLLSTALNNVTHNSATSSATNSTIGAIAQNQLFNGFSLSGLLSGLGAASPILGLGLGAALGGQSTLGQISGGLGGLLGGLSASAIFAPTAYAGIIGGIGSTFGLGAGAISTIAGALPIVGAVAAPLLLLGSWILGRNKRRRQEEGIRDKAVRDTLGQLDQILADTRAHKYNSGQEAIDAAVQVRENYRSQMNQLKDSKTRRHALAEIGGRINTKIDQIRAAAGTLDTDRAHFEDLIPEFATGGIVPGQTGSPRLVLAHGGELIANLHQQTPELMRAAASSGVPGIRGNVGNHSSNYGGGGNANPQNISVELFVGTETQNQMFVNGAKSQRGFKIQSKQQDKKAKFDDRTASF